MNFMSHCRALCLATLCALTFFGTVASAETSMSKEEYRTLFSGILAKHLADGKNANACLPLYMFGTDGSRTFDVQVQLPAIGQNPQVQQFQALANAGLLEVKGLEKTINNKSEPFLSARLSPKGISYFSKGQLCYGRTEFASIIKWKGPIVLGEYKAVLIYYTASLSNVPDWAKLPAIQSAFPVIREAIQNSGGNIHNAVIDLSSEGWEVSEMSKSLQ